MSESKPTVDQVQPGREQERRDRGTVQCDVCVLSTWGIEGEGCLKPECSGVMRRINPTPAPVPVEQRCVEPMLSIPAQWIINHYDRVKHLDYACEECCRDRDDSTVVNGFICIYHQAKAALRVFTPSANSEELMHEDELPPDMPKEDYDKWYAQSRVIDSIGCRIGPRYPFAAPAPESEVSEPRVDVKISRETGGAYADPKQVIESELHRIKQERSTPSASTGTEELLPSCAVCHAIGIAFDSPFMAGWFRITHKAGCKWAKALAPRGEHEVFVKPAADVGKPVGKEEQMNEPEKGKAPGTIKPPPSFQPPETCGEHESCRDRAANTRTTPSPSGDAEKEARKAFEDIAHLARERVNVPASEVYALLEHIDRRASVALEDLASWSEQQSDDKGDRD